MIKNTGFTEVTLNEICFIGLCRTSNIFMNSFSKLAYSLRRPCFGPYPDLSMSVLTNRRVVEAIHKVTRRLDGDHDGTGIIHISITTFFSQLVDFPKYEQFYEVSRKGTCMWQGTIKSVLNCAC